jgi:hypothetical protein
MHEDLVLIPSTHKKAWLISQSLLKLEQSPMGVALLLTATERGGEAQMWKGLQAPFVLSQR